MTSRISIGRYLLVGDRSTDGDVGLQPLVALVTRPCPQTLGVLVHGERAHVLAVHVVPQREARAVTTRHADAGTGQLGLVASTARGRFEVDVVTR